MILGSTRDLCLAVYNNVLKWLTFIFFLGIFGLSVLVAEISKLRMNNAVSRALGVQPVCFC